MESTNLCITNNDLLNFINLQYAVQGEKIRLHRTSGGRVYYIYCQKAWKVLKLYRPLHTECAIQTTQVIPYLRNCGFPIVQIIPTVTDEMYITVDMPEGKCVGILFEFAKGTCIGFLDRWRDNKQPSIHPKTRLFCRQVGLMHRLMENYEGSIIHKNKDRYINDSATRS